MPRQFYIRPLPRVVHLFICLVALFGLHSTKSVWAHGGVIIDGGVAGKVEWIFTVNPYPTTPGETIIDLILYDIDTYAPLTDLTVDLYFAPPESTAPCCDPATHGAPYRLVEEPELYPGSYSSVFNLQQTGTWSALFVVQQEGRVYQLRSNMLEIHASEGNTRSPVLEAETLRATVTAAAQTPLAEPIPFTPQPQVSQKSAATATPTAIAQSPIIIETTLPALATGVALPFNTAITPMGADSPLPTPAAASVIVDDAEEAAVASTAETGVEVGAETAVSSTVLLGAGVLLLLVLTAFLLVRRRNG